MIVQDILNHKGSEVYSIEPTATVDDAVQALTAYNVGALLVCEPGEAENCPRIHGIITERDVLRICAARKGPLDQLSLAEYMTKGLHTGRPGDTLKSVMSLMTEKRIRHLPILEGGELRGIVSLGDLVKAHNQEVQLENHLLRDYLQTPA